MTRAFLPPLSHNLGQYLDAIHLRRAVRRGARFLVEPDKADRLGGCRGPDELAARSRVEPEPVVGSWRTAHRFGSPQKRTPWLNREVLSCRWRRRRHLLQGIGCTAVSAKALLNGAIGGRDRV
jgi:hypothetical protein